MINSFSVKGFKQFDSLSIRGIKPITLIGGRNNCGKTSLLEALFMFYGRVDPRVISRELSWRGMYSVELSPESL